MKIENHKITPHDLKVFYDGQCVICSKEIDMYRKKDFENKINFVDISASQFSATAEGLDPKKIIEVFHVKDAQHQLHTGVDGFVAIWDILGILKPLSLMAKSKVTRPFFDFGYFAFTKIRPFLPRQECPDGSCRI